jgi:hypothetical protein
MNEIEKLEAVLVLGISAISAEHFFSAGMSSPWSVSKFATSDEDKRQVWRLFKYAAYGSIIFAVIIGLALGGAKAFWYAVGGAGAITAWMWYEYREALEGRL